MKFLTLLSALFMMSFMLQMNPAQAEVADPSTLTSVNGKSGNIAGPQAIDCPTGNCAKNMKDIPGGFAASQPIMPDGDTEVKKTTKEGTVTK